YAKRAGYFGLDMPLWNVWLEIQGERGLELATAVEELSTQDRRWLGAACLRNGRDDVGILAYALYLGEPEGTGPFTDETREFLDALVRAGRGQEALRWVERLEQQSDNTPEETLWAARHLLDSGELLQARQRIDRILARH